MVNFILSDKGAGLVALNPRLVSSVTELDNCQTRIRADGVDYQVLCNWEARSTR